MTKQQLKFIKNGMFALLLTTIPIVIIHVTTMISEGYSFDFISTIMEDTLLFGLIGVIISILYTYFSKHYGKLSKRIVLFLIVGYYLVLTTLFLMGVYLNKVGSGGIG